MSSLIDIVDLQEDELILMISKGNEEAYFDLRNAYNKNNSNILLFVLHMYSFQNIIRFNKKQVFNTPVGVAGYSDDLKTRILSFIPKTKQVKITNLDYLKIDFNSFPKDSLFYFDPPYFITNAAYNDGKRGGKGWSIKEETELLNYLLVLPSLASLQCLDHIPNQLSYHRLVQRYKLLHHISFCQIYMYLRP